MTLFTLIATLLLVLTSFSGFGAAINIDQKCLEICGCAVAYYMFSKNTQNIKLGGLIAICISICCSIILLDILLVDNVKLEHQMLNYCTLYGIIIGASILSRLKWEKTNYFKVGVVFGLLALFLVNLFLPDKLLSGWNPNSSIYILPGALCAMAMLFYHNTKISIICFYGLAALLFFTVLQLENRSTLITVGFMALLPIATANRILKSKKIFRILYITVIALNVLIPLFQEVVSQSNLYQELMTVSNEFTNKGDDEFGGRTGLWLYAAKWISYRPFLGAAGLRPVYLHNFSMDVLYEFGWIGWSTFVLMLVVLFEKCFNEREERANIFLLAMVCFIILNTFENALLANGAFSILPYFFFAIAWRLKTHPIRS
jgi:hypothetical protein